jgi:hypothetical protein
MRSVPFVSRFRSPGFTSSCSRRSFCRTLILPGHPWPGILSLGDTPEEDLWALTGPRQIS